MKNKGFFVYFPPTKPDHFPIKTSTDVRTLLKPPFCAQGSRPRARVETPGGGLEVYL